MTGPIPPELAERLRKGSAARSNLVAQFAYTYDALMHLSSVYQPFAPEEEVLSEYLKDRAQRHFGAGWYHGGRIGLSPGDKVRSVLQGASQNHDLRQRPKPSYGLVYITCCKSLAQSFANAVRGQVYLVEPDVSPRVAPFILRAFQLIESWHGTAAMESLWPKCLLEFSCPGARVVEICSPVLPLFPIPDRSANWRYAECVA
jgi:hypothetical protein